MMKIAGIVPSPPDDRDYKFIPPADWVPRTENSLDLPVLYDQMQVNSCVTHGMNHQIQIHPGQNGPFHLSRYALYVMTLAAENRIGSPGGLYTRDAYKVAMHNGLIQEQHLAYVNAEPAQDLPQELYQLADEYDARIQEYQLVHPPTADGINTTPDTTAEKIMCAIDMGLAVTVGLSVSDSIYGMTGDWREQNYDPVRFGVPSIGGHLMCVTGYDREAGRFKVANSWANWGDNGYGGFPFETLVASPYLEAYVVRKFDGIGNQDAPGFYFDEQNDHRAQVRLTVADEMVGSTTKLWIGAKLPDGTLMMKKPYFALGSRGDSSQTRPLTATDIRQNNSLLDMNGGYDQWGLAVDGADPIHTAFPLKKHNTIKVFGWSWLPDIAGTEIYMEYGDTLNFNEVQHVMTVG